MTTTAVASPDRIVRCRYLRRKRLGVLERCTAQVAEEGSEIDLCEHHLASAMQLLVRKGINISGSN